MKQVKVIAPGGASVAGPTRVTLSRAQWARRQAMLGAVRKSGVYALDGDQRLAFKEGEEIGIDTAEKLNRQLFAWEDEEADKAPADGAKGNDTVAPQDTVGGGNTVAPADTVDDGA